MHKFRQSCDACVQITDLVVVANAAIFAGSYCIRDVSWSYAPSPTLPILCDINTIIPGGSKASER